MPTQSDRDYLLLRAYQVGITERRELAGFMGQMEVESGGFNNMHENLNYSGQRLLQVFPGRNGINTLEDANAIAQGGPEAVANAIYGGDWGRQQGALGNTEPGDGWRFHGRGYVQLTGRDNYTRAAHELGIDLVGTPDLAAERETAANIALHYWNVRVVANGHQLDVSAATQDINGGDNHFPERRAAVARWERALTPGVMAGLARGEVLLPAVSRQYNKGDQTVAQIQQNLNQLGITDARGQLLIVDGNSGGPNSRTNEVIAAFQERFGIDGQRSNTELLAATQVALNNPIRNLDETLRGLLPPGLQPRAPRMVDGMPDYLLPGHASAQRAPVESTPQHTNRNAPTHDTPPPQPVESATLPPLPKVELQQGDRGAAVLALQAHLRMIGATDRAGRALQPDRDYGARTKEAVEQFQLWTGREATGIADKDTLQELEAHARFAVRQRAQGVPAGDHLADNLKPLTPADTALAADPYLPPTYPTPRTTPSSPASPAITDPAQSRQPAGLQPFSHPDHPQHALYADVRQRFGAKGIELSEAQLSDLTRQMHGSGYAPGWEGDVTVYKDKAVVGSFQIGSRMASIDMTMPAPSVQDTMKAFQADQQALAQGMERLHQQQAVAQDHHGLGL